LIHFGVIAHLFRQIGGHSITLSINETIHQKVFFKNFDQKFFNYEGFS